MIKLGKLFAGIGIVGVLGLGQAQAAILDEGFDGAIPPPGWTIINNSSPIGTTSWFQGDHRGLHRAGGRRRLLYRGELQCGGLRRQHPRLAAHADGCVAQRGRVQLLYADGDRIDLRRPVGGSPVHHSTVRTAPPPRASTRTPLFRCSRCRTCGRSDVLHVLGPGQLATPAASASCTASTTRR